MYLYIFQYQFISITLSFKHISIYTCKYTYTFMHIYANTRMYLRKIYIP
jgi:hypothetical protein